MKLAVLDPNVSDYWMEAHKAGCADLRKKDRWGQPRGRDCWYVTAETLVEAAEAIAGDFIEEGSMTVDEAVDVNIHWAPCVTLPRGEVGS